MARKRKRYTTTITRRLRQLGACRSGLQYVAGKTFDQAWEMVWKQWPELRAYYFEDGHSVYTRVTAAALDTSVGVRSQESRALNVVIHEAPLFLRANFRLTAQRWAKVQGLRVAREAWKEV